MLMIKNEIKIYADETMGLLDEKGLEAVAMVIKICSCGDETMVAMEMKCWLLWRWNICSYGDETLVAMEMYSLVAMVM